MKKKLVVVGMLAAIAGVVAVFKSRKKYTKVRKIIRRKCRMKLFKNRTVLGIFCIAVSLIICFAITPLVNAGLSKKVTIVRFNRQVNEREEITRSMLDEVDVGNHNLTENVIRNIADVE